MSKYFNSKYSALTPYTPGEQPQNMEYVKLNTNESPYPVPDEVIREITQGELEKLRLYNDPECKILKGELARVHGVGPENVFTSNGSDDILNFAFMAFGEDGARYADITYGFYPVFAALNGVKSDICPLKDDFTADIEDYLGAGKLVVLANPNAPTGIPLKLEDIEKICRENRSHIVLIDEAYVDFGTDSAVPLTKTYDNLLVVQTFSKSRSMAGARLGFAIGNAEIIADLETLKYSTNPYNVNRLTQLLGTAALRNDAYFKENAKKIEETRAYATAELKKRGFTVLPSTANFVFARSPEIEGGRLYEELKKRGVLVRHFTAERISDFNRITIGTREQMDTLLARIDEITDEAREHRL